MICRKPFSGYGIKTTVLIVAFFLPGCWTKLQFPPGSIVFKQQQTAGTVIATISLDEELPGSSITLEGCFNCLELQPSRADGSVDLVIKSPFVSATCIATLNNSVNTDQPELRNCPATFTLRNASSDVIEVKDIKIFVNQEPKLTLEEEIVTQIEENIAIQTIIIKRITSADPDPGSPPYHARILKIESCFQLQDSSLCPFRLGGTACHPNGLSCTWNSPEPGSYSLSLVKALDYESEQVLIVQLSLTDAIEQSSNLQNTVYQSITISIIDVQDTPPQFMEYPALGSVDELEEVGTTIFSVHAIDGDRGKNQSAIEYTLCQVIGTDCSSTPHLQIQKNATTGKGDVVIVRSFTVNDFPGAYIDVNITASEVGVSEKGMTVLPLKILVNDVNDKPAVFLSSVDSVNWNELALPVSSLQAYIDENAAVGTPMEFANQAVLRVQDLDGGVNARFSLTLSESDIFVISPSLGQGDVYVTLRVKNNIQLDTEKLPSINISIYATALASPFQITTLVVAVKVRDVNDNPSLFTPCGANHSLDLNASETVFNGNKITLLRMGYSNSNGKLQDSDIDEENRNVTQFRILEFDQPSFAVSADGNLEVVDRLDFETKQQHLLTIEMNNIGRNGKIMSSQCKINVAVLDVNDEAPKIHNEDTDRTFSIDEIHTGPVTVYSIRASDQDATANLVFTLKLDRADGPRGLPAKNFDLSKYLTIITVPPATPSEEWIGNFNVTEAFDRETTETIEATVTVTDINADPSSLVPQNAQFRIVINVKDVNDNIPTLQFNNKELKDNDIINQNIQEFDAAFTNLDFSVTDRDITPDPAVFYPFLRLNTSGNFENHILIDEKTEDPNFIRLIIKKHFDYMETKNFTFFLVVFDSDPNLNLTALSTTVEIRLQITDKNNQNPKIIYPINYDSNSNPKIYEIKETNSNSGDFVPERILQVEATDDDSDLFLPFEYFLSFTTGTPLMLEQSIKIDSTNGVISVIKPLDREAPGMDGIFILQLRVRDNANQAFDRLESAITTFAVKILDINDNAPKFANPNGYSVTLLEKDNIAGKNLLFVDHQAADKDEAEGCGKISYSLVTPKDNVSLPLTIDENTASLNLTGKLVQDLVFYVAAFDGKIDKCRPGHTTETKMTIKIIAENLLYEIIVNLEVDDQKEPNETLNAIKSLLDGIANQAGYDFVFHSIQKPSTGSATLDVINFSFLNRTDRSAMPKEQLTALLSTRINDLTAMGVRSIGTAVPVDEKPDEAFDPNIIAIIVLALLALILLITAAVFCTEKKKLTRKLRVYKATEAVGVENQGNESSSSPYAATGIQRNNPIQEQFGENVDLKTFVREDSLAENADMDIDRADDKSLNMEETISQSRKASTDFQSLRTATAETNRRNIQGQLRNSVFR